MFPTEFYAGRTLQTIRGKTSELIISEDEKKPHPGGGAEDRLAAGEDRIRILETELERYRLAVSESREGLWDWHVPSGRMWYSPRTIEILGLEDNPDVRADEWKFDRDAWVAAIHPDDRAWVTEALDNHLKRNASYDLEYRLRRPDGEYRWLRTMGKTVRDDDGDAVRMLGAIKDLTEEKAAEDSRRRNEAYFKALLDSTNIGVTITRADGSYVLTNGAYQKLVGYGAEELQKMRWQDISHSEEIGRIENDIQSMAGEGAHDIAFEKRFLHKNGGTVWARLTMSLFGGEAGETPLRAAIVEDITERKLAEQALRDSQAVAEATSAYLTGALESMDNGFALFDADERLVMCNEQFRGLAPEVTHLYEPGTRFADIIRGGTERGQWRVEDGDKEDFIARRLSQFRTGGRFELPRADGAWIEAYDHKTEDGQLSHRHYRAQTGRRSAAAKRSESKRGAKDRPARQLALDCRQRRSPLVGRAEGSVRPAVRYGY